MKHKEKDRKLELSGMFLEMGQSLIAEGNKKNDYTIAQCGSFFVMIAGIVLSEEDVFLFSEICSMFSSKKILEHMEKTNNPAFELLKNKSNNESYEDYIKRINKLRGDKGHEPLK